MTLIKIILLPLLSGSFLFASSGSSLYTKHCKSCHGVTGKIKAMGKSKAINGMSIKTTQKTMQDYATGKRKSMSIIKKMKKDFLKKHSEAEIHAVYKYIQEL